MLYKKYAQMNLITPRMMSSTIMSDERSCLWFRKLLSQPSVMERLNASEEARPILDRYRSRTLAAGVLSVLTLGLCLDGLFFLQPFSNVLNICAVIAAAGCGFFLFQARRDLAALAAHLVTLDNARIPPGTTLFQLGEIYARHDGAPSLVTVIWIWDQWQRNMFLMVFLIAFGVLFLPSWVMVAGLMAGCAVTASLVKIWVLTRQNGRPGIQRTL